MESSKFLEKVADYIVGPIRESNDLADVTVICPNRRSSMFLKRYMQLRVVGPCAVMMPRFATMQGWIERLASQPVPDRWEALFALFDSYRQVMKSHGSENQAGTFDRFIFWGDLILNDFDDIDKSLADPHALYTNLYRLHQITSDYLTDSQKEVVNTLWGETPMTGEVDRFWYHVGKGGPTAEKFVTLWQVMAELYDTYHQTLAEHNMASAGKQIRAVADKILQTPIEHLRRDPTRYIFVGLSDMTPAEVKILDRLRDAGVATFFWDLAPVDDFAGSESEMQRGLRSIRSLSRRYPMPDDFVLDKVSQACQIDIYGIASKTGQAKLAGQKIAELMPEMTPEAAINTAVVVPDPSILMPLMLALPPGLPGLNVTMALPFATTTFATLLRAVIVMQNRARQHRGIWTFYYQDVLEILAHPHIRLIGGSEAEAIRNKIMRGGHYNVDPTQMGDVADKLKFIFRVVENRENVSDVFAYLAALLAGLRSGFINSDHPNVNPDSIEFQSINALLERLDKLDDLVNRYEISMSETTLFTIFEKLLFSGQLTLTGTPLQGLQVMGVLETRALDFDNIIFLSLNERTFPRRDNVRTMIPNSLRRGYGLPPVESDESRTSYLFYRAISRARHVMLIYDSRPPGRSAGEVSRYVTQLNHLGENNKRINITQSVVDMTAGQPTRIDISVAKTDKVLAELDAFKPGGQLRLSASALKTYLSCPLAFYLMYIKRYSEPEDPTDYISSIVAGNIFHHAMQELYRPYIGKTITAADIDRMLANGITEQKLLEQMSVQRFKSTSVIPYSYLPVEAQIVHTQLLAQLNAMLEVEREQYCPFVYVDGERDIIGPWKVTDDLTVNFRMQIDRIDRTGDMLRFIDYKTGKDDNSAGSSITNLFTADHKRHAIFQLLLYCEAYADMVDANAKIKPALHLLREIVVDGEIKPLTLNRQEIEPFPALHDEFRPLLNDLISKIFDDTTPFSQCPDTKPCKNCSFLNLCGRNLPPEFDRG